MQVLARAFVFLLFTTGSLAIGATGTAYESDRLHDGFNELLSMHVSDGRVDYGGFDDNPGFADYLRRLALAKPDSYATDAEKLAFWINAYNALAIKGILDGLSPSNFFGRIAYFRTKTWDVAGRSLSLYTLEHDIIVPFGDPRIHFAIVCASLSCPRLRSEAYLGSQLDRQLEESTIDFINDPAKNEFDAGQRLAHISMIFDWFEKDFEKHGTPVGEFLALYVSDESHRQALRQGRYRIRYLDYNWNLNGTPSS